VRTSPSRTTTALTATECALLGLLARHEELSGYDLTKLVRQGVGYVWTPARSRIYAVLPRLVRAGLATGRAVAQEQRPDKQLFRITDAGRLALRDWLARPDWRSHDEFLLKLFFGDLIPAETVVELVRRYRAEERERLAEYREIEQRIAGHEADRFGYATLRWGLASSPARIAWADELLRELEAAA
jgi:DNA-binding PadR family transcriptional regulator